MRNRGYIEYIRDKLLPIMFRGRQEGCAAYRSAFDHAKESLWGRFYFRHVRDIAVLRDIVRAVWSYVQPYYSRLMFINITQTPFAEIFAYAAHNRIEINRLHQAETVHTPQPEIYPEAFQDYLSLPHDQYSFPDIKLSVIKNGKVRGHTNFVVAGKVTLHHELYDLERELTVEEATGVVLIINQKKTIAWFPKFRASTMECAASFTDGCANNFAHWMSEVLPRLAVFAQCPDFAEVPLLVNEGLHPNIIESIGVVAPNHPIRMVGKQEEVLVERLIVMSPGGYAPYDPRYRMRAMLSQGVFSPYALNLVRGISLGNAPIHRDWPRKIYVRRSSSVRNLRNGNEIEGLLLDLGFEIVSPERLSFAEQCALFASANTVVLQAGAACANIIFCKPEASIIIMAAGFKGNAYWYWQHMAVAVGCRVAYVLGTVPSKYAQGIHSDFIVKPDDLKYALSQTA